MKTFMGKTDSKPVDVRLTSADAQATRPRPAARVTPGTSTVIAIRTTSPIVIDGLLDDAAWKAAPSYELSLPDAAAADGRRLQEGGIARFAWDDRHFYLGLELADSDLVAEGTTNGQMHNTLGDTCELMIKPENETWYWEFHVTPAGHSSCFFFPGRGRIVLPSCLKQTSSVRTAARCEGKLNDWKERDLGWTAEMAVPVEELLAHGGDFGPGSRWRVLVGRYNYSRFLSTRGPELSAMPHLSRVDFHLHEEYALVDFAR